MKTLKAGFGERFRPFRDAIRRAKRSGELKHNIREAIAGVLEVLRAQGQEPDLTIQILDVAV